uniref:Uncharacterized protein n=1 Tax=Arundo donax TaxID=35708 RepID=A0A0A8YI13_ARUDO
MSGFCHNMKKKAEFTNNTSVRTGPPKQLILNT